MPTDDFTWWQNALAGKRGPIYDGEPQSGFYRQRRQDKTYEPVAYWKDTATGEQRCHVNGRSPDLQRALEMWPYVSRNPITAEAYWHRIENGKWLDDDAAANGVASGPDIDPELDPAGSLKAEIAKAKAGMDAYKTIESDEQSAKAQTLRSAFTGLKGKATKAYEAENRPLLDKQEKLRKLWFPLRDEAEKAANDLRKAMEAWEDIKRENARRAAEETRKLEEQARRDAEWKGAEPGSINPEPPAPVRPVEPNTPAPARQIKGASGRTASVGTKKVVTAIKIDEAFAQFRDDPELYAFFMDLSQKVVDAGFVAIGATIEEKSAIR